jgi:Domain of unknown function (DUF4160)
MPVVFRHNGARFHFFSNEGSPREPVHIHVLRGDCEAKLWVEPNVSVAESFGFTRRELAELTRIVLERRDEIIRAWHEHFG